MRAGEDDGLRRLAIEKLGPLGPQLAREALDSGVADVEPDVLAWTGSTGAVRGHRVVLWLDPELCARVRETPSVVDALTASLAAAVAAAPGNALAELVIGAREATGPRRSAYRGCF